MTGTKKQLVTCGAEIAAEALDDNFVRVHLQVTLPAESMNKLVETLTESLKKFVDQDGGFAFSTFNPNDEAKVN